MRRASLASAALRPSRDWRIGLRRRAALIRACEARSALAPPARPGRLEREIKRADELADRLSLHQFWRRFGEAVHRARPRGQGADGHLPKVVPQLTRVAVQARWIENLRDRVGR